MIARYLKIAACAAILIAATPCPVVAQATPAPAMPTHAPDPAPTPEASMPADKPIDSSEKNETFSLPKSEGLSRIVSDDDDIIKDGYVVPTFRNLSKLYWSMAMFDLSDNQAIDSYLMINECELYKKYINSDFELDGLRDATRQSIAKSLSSFPMKYEIMIPIGLDRYNIGTEKFQIDPRTQFNGSKRLEIAMNSNIEPICGNGGRGVPKYPRNFVLSLSRPFAISQIPVPPEVAQFYIERMEKEGVSKPARFTISKYGRLAYIRMKVTMNQFKGYTMTDPTTMMADIFGTIDGYDIYGDWEKTLLLYSPENEAKNPRAKKATPSTITIPANEPLIKPEDPATKSEQPTQNISPETGSVISGYELPPINPPKTLQNASGSSGTLQSSSAH